MLVLGVRVGDFFTALLAIDEIIDHTGLQWAGSKQCQQRHNIFETIRLQPFDQLFHTPRFQLENGCSLSRPEQLKAAHIVQRYLQDLQWQLPCPRSSRVNHFYCPIDDGQSAQTEEVELHQTRVFHITLVELCDQTRTTLVTVKR